MRELPKIDADVVIEISKLLEEHPHMVPVPVHKARRAGRQRIKAGLSDQSIEESVVEMAPIRQLAAVFDLPSHGDVVPLPVRR